jgi:hypothetical protein
MIRQVLLTLVCGLGIGSIDLLLAVLAWNFLIGQPAMVAWLLIIFVAGPAFAWMIYGSYCAVCRVWQWSGKT